MQHPPDRSGRNSLESAPVTASIVIPVYQATPELTRLVNDLTQTSKDKNEDIEVVLAVDSRDARTLSLTKELLEASSSIKRIVLTVNSGQQAATAAGILASRGQIVVTMDDDYQHAPSDAFDFISMLRENPSIDLIYGTPRNSHQGMLRAFSGTVFRFVMRLSGSSHLGMFSPFRAFRGEFRRALNLWQGPNIAVDVALSWAASNVQEVPIQFLARRDGKSGYSTKARWRLGLKLLVAQTTAPLRLGIWAGFAGVLGSLGLAAAVLFEYFRNQVTVPGFTMTILVILLLGSAQLIVLGILGVYVGEQHRRGLGQPPYFLSSRE